MPTVARLRIHAIPFPVQTGGEEQPDVVRGIATDEYMMFQKQIIIENIGDAAVQLMGRWHKVTAAWESTSLGDRSHPHGNRSHGVLIMPGDTVMEQRPMQIRGTEGEVSGGFLVCNMRQQILLESAQIFLCIPPDLVWLCAVSSAPHGYCT